MRVAENPELLDRLAAQYALGVLRGGARRRLEAHARRDPAVRTAIGHWQARLSAVAELQATAEPVDKVWCGIEQRLGWKAAPEAMVEAVPEPAPVPLRQPAPAPRPQRDDWWRRMWGEPTAWRMATAAMAIVTVLAIAIGRQFAPEPTPPEVMAVLNDGQARPAMLVSWDARAATLFLRRLDHLRLNDQQILQLWALPADGKPQSLGLLGRDREIRLRLGRSPEAIPALAVSIEPLGGSPNPDGPSGPVVFKGAVLRGPAI